MKTIRIRAFEPVVRPDDEFVAELHENALVVSRIEVPGGWLVVISTFPFFDEWNGDEERSSHALTTNTIFVSDPDHKWRAANDAVDSKEAS